MIFVIFDRPWEPQRAAGMLVLFNGRKNNPAPQKIILTSMQKEKQAQKNRPTMEEKTIPPIVFFFLPKDGKPTIEFACP